MSFKFSHIFKQFNSKNLFYLKSLRHLQVLLFTIDTYKNILKTYVLRIKNINSVFETGFQSLVSKTAIGVKTTKALTYFMNTFTYFCYSKHSDQHNELYLTVFSKSVRRIGSTKVLRKSLLLKLFYISM